MITLLILLYKLLERIDGEKGYKYIPYYIAERLKIKLLRGIK